MLESVFNNDASLRVCNIIKKKFQHMYFPVKFAKFLRTLSLNNISEQLLLYFHYNPHQHYRYHHFHYHCKMHLYHLRILLTIPLDCNMFPGCSDIYLSLVLFQTFCFLCTVKGLRIRL